MWWRSGRKVLISTLLEPPFLPACRHLPSPPYRFSQRSLHHTKSSFLGILGTKHIYLGIQNAAISKEPKTKWQRGLDWPPSIWSKQQCIARPEHDTLQALIVVPGPRSITWGLPALWENKQTGRDLNKIFVNLCLQQHSWHQMVEAAQVSNGM